MTREKHAAERALAQQHSAERTPTHPVPHPTFTAGGYGAGDPPDPIPNSEVKTRCADGTAGATRWESTAPPANLKAHARFDREIRGGRGLFYVHGKQKTASRREQPEELRAAEAHTWFSASLGSSCSSLRDAVFCLPWT